MSGGRFLVGLRETSSSEKIIKIKSLLKCELDFNNILIKDRKTDAICNETKELLDEIANLNIDCEKIVLSDNSREVAYHIAGYIAKKLCKKIGICCSELFINKNSDGNNPDYDYLQVLSRGRSTLPSTSLANYVCTSFAILEITSKFIELSVINDM